MDRPGAALYVRRGRLPSGWWEVRAFASDEVEDGSIREGDEPDIPWGWSVEEAPAPALARVGISPGLVEDPPPLWFVLVDEPRANPRAVNLVGYADEVVEPGTVIPRFTFPTLRVPNDHQVGAVRWYPATGRVHQIFVAPPWRRRRVASTLLIAADAVHQANGWAGVLHGDGRRTVLGQLFVDTLRFQHRIAVLDRVEPPMDPDVG